MPRNIQYFLLSIIISMSLMMGACKKENIDKKEVEEEEVPIDTVFCNLAVSIFEIDSSGTPFLKTSVTGGDAPFSYIWSEGSTIDRIPPSTVGDYTVTVTDSNGCTDEDTYTYSSSDPCFGFTLEINSVADSMSMTEDLTAAASGGTTPYFYSWSTGDTSETIEVNLGGVYTVTVIDAVGCILEETYP